MAQNLRLAQSKFDRAIKAFHHTLQAAEVAPGKAGHGFRGLGGLGGLGGFGGLGGSGGLGGLGV